MNDIIESKTNILIVEDSPSMRALTATIVESIGYQPLLAESGEQALEIFDSNEVDLAILDVNLPGINGFETCRQLRARQPESWFPVIYLSSNDSDNYVIEGLDAGGDAYVKKPVNTRVLISIVSAMGRISDMKKALASANKKLTQLASIDGLTQIPNRRSFEEALDKYWRQSKRIKQNLALVLVDVDYFKPYNDTYGHLQGDDCLRQVAQILQEQLLRPLDSVARYGGEEFAVLLPAIDHDGANLVANRMLKAIRDASIPHSESPFSKRLSISLGVAFFSQSTSKESLIENADSALYQAKESGRNRVHFFPRLDAS